jgi:long-subunit acyl-CoA synthetase (AMP-forming)
VEIIAMDKFEEEGAKVIAEERLPTPEDIATICYTSGEFALLCSDADK